MKAGNGFAAVLLAVFLFVGLLFLGGFIAAVAYNISLAALFGLPKATMLNGVGVMVLSELLRKSVNVRVNK